MGFRRFCQCPIPALFHTLCKVMEQTLQVFVKKGGYPPLTKLTEVTATRHYQQVRGKVMRSSYIEGLHRLLEDDDDKRQVAKQEAQHTIKCLEQQLIELIRTFNREEISHGWHISEFVMRCEGAFAEHPHPQKVSEILTRQGWSKRRVYNAAMGINGKRLWFAPQQVSIHTYVPLS